MNFYVHEKQMDQNSEYYTDKVKNLRAAEESYKNHNLDSSSFPVKVNIQTNYSCNARCISCPVRRPTDNQRIMDVNLFDSIAKETFPTAVMMSTTTIGEPLLLPWFQHLCDVADQYSVMADIVTNGMLMNENNIESMLSVAADIKISYDSSTEEMFETIRPGCKKSVVDDNISFLMTKRKELSPIHNPTITFQTTLLKNNVSQLPDIARIASECEADCLKAYYMISYSENTDQYVLAGDDDKWKTYVDEAIDVAKSNGLKCEIAERSSNGFVELTERSCPTIWYQTWIDYDGKIYPCHSHNGFSVGNVRDGIQNIWNCQNYHLLRNASKNDGDLPCYQCGMLFERMNKSDPVLYDRINFMSSNSKKREGSDVRWSNRTRLFDCSD